MSTFFFKFSSWSGGYSSVTSPADVLSVGELKGLIAKKYGLMEGTKFGGAHIQATSTSFVELKSDADPIVKGQSVLFVGDTSPVAQETDLKSELVAWKTATLEQAVRTEKVLETVDLIFAKIVEMKERLDEIHEAMVDNMEGEEEEEKEESKEESEEEFEPPTNKRRRLSDRHK